VKSSRCILSAKLGIHAEPRTFDHSAVTRHGFAVEKGRKRLAQHRRSGARQKPCAAGNVTQIVRYGQQVGWIERVILVDFAPALDRNIPVESLPEHTCSQRVHLINKSVSCSAFAVSDCNQPHAIFSALLRQRENNRI
jgi:hypothetical protein